MVRHYKTKNPVCPGSKLSKAKVLGIIHWLMMGRLAGWIAKKEEISKNAVTTISKKFRDKLWNSKYVRCGFFELFYKNNIIDQKGFIYIADIPINAPEEYFDQVTYCVYHCPSRFEVKREDYLSSSKKFDAKIANKIEAQKAVEAWTLENENIPVFTGCKNCTPLYCGPFKERFYAGYKVYLKERKLTKKSVKDYYFLFALKYLTHKCTMLKLGFEDDAKVLQVPDSLHDGTFVEKYVKLVTELLIQIVSYGAKFLEEDPL